MRRAACGSVQPVVRLLPYLYAYRISIITHSYDAIRTIIQPNKTTYEETNSYGRDTNSTAVLRAQQSTDISQTFSTTNGRLPDDGTFTMPQRRRSCVR